MSWRDSLGGEGRVRKTGVDVEVLTGVGMMAVQYERECAIYRRTGIPLSRLSLFNLAISS